MTIAGHCKFCGAGPREWPECEDVRCDIEPEPGVHTAFSERPATLASGECHTGNYKTDPYHFYLAQQLAEEGARAINRERRKQREQSEPAPANLNKQDDAG